MNTRILKLTTLTFILIGSALLFTNCQTELNEETNFVEPVIKSEKIVFNNTIHFQKLERILHKINDKLKKQNSQKGNSSSNIEILTEEVLYISYGNTHTYTFKIRRENPKYWLENIVLFYDFTTNKMNG